MAILTTVAVSAQERAEPFGPALDVDQLTPIGVAAAKRSYQ
jgi:hypothetical protein